MNKNLLLIILCICLCGCSLTLSGNMKRSVARTPADPAVTTMMDYGVTKEQINKATQALRDLLDGDWTSAYYQSQVYALLADYSEASQLISVIIGVLPPKDNVIKQEHKIRIRQMLDVADKAAALYDQSLEKPERF